MLIRISPSSLHLCAEQIELCVLFHQPLKHLHGPLPAAGLSDCTEVGVRGVTASSSEAVNVLSLSCLCPCTATHPPSAHSQGQPLTTLLLANFLIFISYNIWQILTTEG